MESIKKTDNKIIAAIVALGLAGVSWVVYQHMKRTPPSTTSHQERDAGVALRESVKSQMEQVQNSERLLIRVLKSIKRTIQEDRMTYETVKAIYQGQYQLSRREFQLLVDEKRAERRRLIGDLPRYMQAISDWDDKLQDIHNNHLNAILAHFKIDKEGWMNMVTAMSNDNKESWDQLILDCEKEEFDSVRNQDKPPVRLPVLVDIIKYKRKLLRENEAAFKEAAKDDKNALFLLMEKWIADNVFTTYKVEEEDLNYSIQKLSAEQRQKFDPEQEEMLQLMQQMVLGDDYEGEESSVVV